MAGLSVELEPGWLYRTLDGIRYWREVFDWNEQATPEERLAVLRFVKSTKFDAKARKEKEGLEG